MTESRKLGVGIIGAGEVFQSICDISLSNVQHCATKFRIPHQTTNPKDVLSNGKVDVVFILTSDDIHAELAVDAIEAGKLVMIEKPITLSLPAAQSILDAEKAAGGSKVFVGYMRRYAPSYLQAFKREVQSMPKISYARVRDFSGPNAFFVNNSGTFPIKPTDFPDGSGSERDARLEKLFAEAFPGQDVTDEHRKYCRFLGSLGSHDFSLMRETIGFPEKVVAVSAHEPFYSSMMTFRNKDGSPFSVTYESGIDEVPDFDAHLAVYSAKKRVSIKYASPYVKGLPITVEVSEVNENGEHQTRSILSSYEDAYTAELKEVYECFVNGKQIKTTAEDAMQDLRLYDAMYSVWQRQKKEDSWS